VSVTRNTVKTAVWLQAWAKDAGTWMLVQSEGSGVVLPASRGHRVADALREASGRVLQVPYLEAVPGEKAWFITDFMGPGVRVALTRNDMNREVIQIVQVKYWSGHCRVLDKKGASIMMSRLVAHALGEKIEELLGEGPSGAPETTAPTGEVGIAQVG